jgi:hypothetical protein
MTEWWQRDAGDEPAPVPRRDVVPDAGFSDPRTVNPDTSNTSFIPDFREHRRKRAIYVTAIGALIIGSRVIALVDLYRVDVDQEIRRTGAFHFFLFGFLVIAVGLTLWFVWKWANARDPRDILNRSTPR